MSQAHDVIQSLLNNLPVSQLSSDEYRATFEKIKQRIASASDLQEELKSLYKVNELSDFALSLMWIADRVEKNPLMLAASEEDERLVFSSFRSAIGDAVPQPMTSETLPTEQDAFGAFMQGETAQEPMSGFETSLPGAEQPMAEPVMAGGGVEKGFSALVEKFVEAMQSGDDSRVQLLGQVLAECDIVASGEFPDDYKEYCRSLSEFLQYISENQFLDDVRVMNILSNVSSPVSQWANAAPDARAGLLEDGIAPLRDFKSLFE